MSLKIRSIAKQISGKILLIFSDAKENLQKLLNRLFSSPPLPILLLREPPGHALLIHQGELIDLMGYALNSGIPHI